MAIDAARHRSSYRWRDGSHTLVLKHPEAIDEQRQIWVADDMTINVSMWLRRSTAMLLKPAYPGASIGDVAFLQDGRLALSMSVPVGSTNTRGRVLREPWIYDPTRASLAQFTIGGSSPRAAEAAISADGHHVAYLQPDESAPHADGVRVRLMDVWVATADTNAPPVRVFALRSANASPTSGSPPSGDIEEVHDLSWTPHGDHLLVIVRLATLGGGYAPAPDLVYCWWTPPRNTSRHRSS